MVFASCVRLSSNDAFDPTYVNLCTGAAAGSKSDWPTLAGFVRTGAGKGWLAASGKADDVLIHSVERSRNALYIELTDRSRLGYLGSWHSKAFMNVADQLAVLGGYSGLSPSVSRIDGEELLRAFAQATLAAENSAKYPLLHNKV